MDSFENLVIALGSRKFYRIDVWRHGPQGAQPRPHARSSSWKGNWKGLKAWWRISTELLSHPPPPALGEKWIAAAESTLVDNIIGVYFFPPLYPIRWLSPQLPGRIERKLFQGKKKKKANYIFEYFWKQLAEWRVLPAAAYKSPLTSEDMSGMVSGTSLPPQHFSSLNSSEWEMPEGRAGFHVPSRKALGRGARYAPDAGHCLAPSILYQKTYEFWCGSKSSFPWRDNVKDKKEYVFSVENLENVNNRIHWYSHLKSSGYILMYHLPDIIHTLT